MNPDSSLENMPVIPAKAGIQRVYSKCSWVLSRNAGLVDELDTGFRRYDGLMDYQR
jgi:hypothetical protein